MVKPEAQIRRRSNYLPGALVRCLTHQRVLGYTGAKAGAVGLLMGLRLWAGMLFATGVLALPAGALAVVQLARRWPAVASPGGLALTIAATWGLLVLVALQAGGRDFIPRRRTEVDEVAADLLRSHRRRGVPEPPPAAPERDGGHERGA